MEEKGEVLASECQGRTGKSRKSARDRKLSFYIHHSKDWIRQESWTNEWMNKWTRLSWENPRTQAVQWVIVPGRKVKHHWANCVCLI